MCIIQSRALFWRLPSLHHPAVSICLRPTMCTPSSGGPLSEAWQFLYYPEVGLGLRSVTLTVLCYGLSILTGSYPGFHLKSPSTKPFWNGHGSCHPATEGLLSEAGGPITGGPSWGSPCCTAVSGGPVHLRLFFFSIDSLLKDEWLHDISCGALWQGPTASGHVPSNQWVAEGRSATAPSTGFKGLLLVITALLSQLITAIYSSCAVELKAFDWLGDAAWACQWVTTDEERGTEEVIGDWN